MTFPTHNSQILHTRQIFPFHIHNFYKYQVVNCTIFHAISTDRSSSASSVIVHFSRPSWPRQKSAPKFVVEQEDSGELWVTCCQGFPDCPARARSSASTSLKTQAQLFEPHLGRKSTQSSFSISPDPSTLHSVLNEEQLSAWETILRLVIGRNAIPCLGSTCHTGGSP